MKEKFIILGLLILFSVAFLVLKPVEAQQPEKKATYNTINKNVEYLEIEDDGEVYMAKVYTDSNGYIHVEKIIE